MELQEYQNQYDAYNNTLAGIKASLKNLKTSAENEGFIIVDGTFKKAGTVIGCVYRESYYSRYVGEKGAMYSGSQGAYNTQKTEEEFEKIYRTVFSLKENVGTAEQYAEMYEMLSDYFPEHCYPPSPDDWAYKHYKDSNYLKDAISLFEDITISDKKISYRYNGNSDQGEMVDGSGFDLGYFDEKWINNFKSSSYEDKFDVHCHGDKIKW